VARKILQHRAIIFCRWITKLANSIFESRRTALRLACQRINYGTKYDVDTRRNPIRPIFRRKDAAFNAQQSKTFNILTSSPFASNTDDSNSNIAR